MYQALSFTAAADELTTVALVPAARPQCAAAPSAVGPRVQIEPLFVARPSADKASWLRRKTRRGRSRDDEVGRVVA
jgi:hypothetical protein